MALTAEHFRDLCRGVADQRASLDSCHDSEAPAEAERLLRMVTELKAATLRRANRELEAFREREIYTAMLAYHRRTPEG